MKFRDRDAERVEGLVLRIRLRLIYHHQPGLVSRIYVPAGVAGVEEGVGRTASALSSLCRMRPEWSVRRSVSPNREVLGCRDDQRRDPRADSSSVL